MTKPTPHSRYQKTNKASASGGYGEVEIWHDAQLDRDVAIKWTAAEHAGQLAKEVEALSQSPSPHVVEIYDVVVAADQTLRGVVLEYLQGDGLEKIDLLPESKTSQAIALLYQMARGLSHLHAASIVHRDVKPANAVCTSSGLLKLVDFGISSRGLGATTIEAKGTLGFAPPELHHGTPPIAVSAAMDVYSFGMVCWAKLAGGLPYVGLLGTPDYANYPLPSLSTARNFPTDLVALIDRALSWQPSDRPSMEQLVAAFRSELLRGKHKARLMLAGRPPYELTTEPGKYSTLGGASGSVEIAYDGHGFRIRNFVGEVRINNRQVAVGDRLEAGCLFSFGDPTRPGRVHVPFRQSAPELIF
jgi:eukaryotic-like serine/threonine-protein kinase